MAEREPDLSHPSHILVCPRCGTLVANKGDEGNYSRVQAAIERGYDGGT